MNPEWQRAATRNLGTHSTWVQARTQGMRARVTPSLSMGDSGLDTDTFNIVSGARLPGSSAALTVRNAVEWYGARPFSWWLSPGDLPTELPAILEASGLRRVEGEEAMHCPLRELSEGRGGWPSDLSVSQVLHPADLRTYSELLAGLADPPDAGVIDFFASAAPTLLTPECPLRLYLGRRAETPVATSQVTLAHGVAGLYNVSTVERERGQGIGTAMTVVPLIEARREGVELAVLQAAGEARRVYARVGFKSAGVVAEYKPVVVADPR